MNARLESILGRADSFQRRRAWLAVPVAVIRKMEEDEARSLAGLVAYYGLLAAFPLLLVFSAVLGFVLAGDASLRAEVLKNAEHSFPALSGYINTTISGSSLAVGTGAAIALWAGLRLTLATERAMDSIWDIPLSSRPSRFHSDLRGLALLAILGMTFLVSTALASLEGGHGSLSGMIDLLGAAGSLLLNFVLYLFAFKLLTNLDVSFRAVLPGAAVGAVGWTILQSLGVLYVRHEVAHASHLYGSLAVVIGLLAWIHLGALFTLFAAEVNAVLGEGLWPRSLSRTPQTDADRKALLRQARRLTESSGENISVDFGRHGSADARGREQPTTAPQ
jgi:YihY family inner membrane protein